MTIRLREVVRSTSEVEGGLTGPANPIPSQSIDCGCGQMQCPKLARFATRGLYVGLICWIGMVQAAIHAYFYVTGSTIARRFQLDPYLMSLYFIDFTFQLQQQNRRIFKYRDEREESYE